MTNKAPALLIHKGQDVTWEVAVGDDGVHFVIKDNIGRTFHWVVSADCAEHMGAGLHYAAKRFEGRAVLQAGCLSRSR